MTDASTEAQTAVTAVETAIADEKHTLLEELHALVHKAEADGLAVLEWPVEKLKALLTAAVEKL